MRKLILPILAAATTLTAAPAAAGHWRPAPAVHREIQRDISQLERRIYRAERRNAISHREARGLRRDAMDLRRLLHRYGRNGLDRREVAEIDWRLNRVHQRLRHERRDWDGRRG